MCSLKTENEAKSRSGGRVIRLLCSQVSSYERPEHVSITFKICEISGSHGGERFIFLPDK
jgi:hypothetical protein